MVKARANILIDRDQHKVYAFIASGFFDNYGRWSPEVKRLEALTPGPLKVGSRMRQVRVDQGRRSESVFRVTAMEAPTRIEFAETTDLFRTSYRIDAAGPQSRLFFGFELRRIELYMRPFEKLIRVAIEDGAQRVVHNIRGLIERQP